MTAEIKTKKRYVPATEDQKDILKKFYRKYENADKKIIYYRVYRITRSAEISAQKRAKYIAQKVAKKLAEAANGGENTFNNVKALAENWEGKE